MKKLKPMVDERQGVREDALRDEIVALRGAVAGLRAARR
jgi:hypothetical protein